MQPATINQTFVSDWVDQRSGSGQNTRSYPSFPVSTPILPIEMLKYANGSTTNSAAILCNKYDVVKFLLEKSISKDERSHMHFLDDAVCEGLISASLAASAKSAWWKLVVATNGRMPVPAACTAPDGKLFYYWDNNQHHLELEFSPNEQAEFFYRNRDEEELWEELLDDAPLNADVSRKLQLFISSMLS